MNYAFLDSPVGSLIIVADEAALRIISFENARYGSVPDPAWILADTPLLRDAKTQLSQYFAGTRRSFELPLASTGTAFQRLVWNALLTIQFGQTASYQDIANSIDRPSALRAVGSANGRNPLPIVIPCHRIIGSNGDLTGFGGGLGVKRWLLEHEAYAARLL